MAKGSGLGTLKSSSRLALVWKSIDRWLSHIYLLHLRWTIVLVGTCDLLPGLESSPTMMPFASRACSLRNPTLLVGISDRTEVLLAWWSWLLSGKACHLTTAIAVTRANPSAINNTRSNCSCYHLRDFLLVPTCSAVWRLDCLNISSAGSWLLHQTQTIGDLRGSIGWKWDVPTDLSRYWWMSFTKPMVSGGCVPWNAPVELWRYPALYMMLLWWHSQRNGVEWWMNMRPSLQWNIGSWLNKNGSQVT